MAEIAKGCRSSTLRVSTSEEERLLFWAGRKAAFPAVGRISPDYYCMDGTIPRAKLPLVLKRIRELSEHYGLRVANVFHAGDGNLHPLILYDANTPGELEKTEEFGSEILKLCVEVGGVLTGEHGVGVEKRDLMPAMFTEIDLEPAAAAQVRVRRAGPAQSRQGVSQAAPLRRTGPPACACGQTAVSGHSAVLTMQFGIFGSAQASTQDLGPETGQGFRDYLDYAVEAEALGYVSSFLVEHHFTGWNQVSATLMLQTALAMRTTTLRLGTAVIVLPWHNPVLLAEQAATLDLISDGRFDFGIGKGYRHNEFAGFRIPMEEAEPRFEESVEVMTARSRRASASRTGESSGSSTTSWSSRRRHSSRIRRSGSRPAARRRSAARRSAASI